VSRVVPLGRAARATLPAPCVDCVFWQNLRLSTEPQQKRRWERTMEERVGPWGRVLRDGERFLGLLQYGPQSAFPRAQIMPAGPPSRDAALITCAYLGDEDPAGTCERLVLEALADLKSRRVRVVETFALRYPDDVPPADRFAGHHTLFDRTFLTRLGFSPVRGVGQVSLMRLEIDGLEPARRSDLVRRALRLPPATETAPRPAVP
jgi:hypothetical protein